MTKQFFTQLALLTAPQLALADQGHATKWWLSALIITQIVVVFLNFSTKRNIKDKCVLLVIYAFAMITPWQHFLTSDKNVMLLSFYLLSMQFLFYWAFLWLENKIKQHTN